MGRYISINLHFQGGDLRHSLLKAAFSSEFFTPMTIYGTRGQRKKQAQRFIAGFDFLGISQRNGYHKVIAAVETDTELEFKSETLHATFLKKPFRLELTALDMLEDWLKSRPYATVDLYGTVNLFSKSNDVELWERTFRDQFLPTNPEYMSPIVQISAQIHRPQPDKTSLHVFSRAEVWLQKGQTALNEHIGQAEADENLQNLAGLMKLIVDAHHSHFEDANILLEGRTFHDEADRIAKAFTDIQPLEIDGYPHLKS